MTNIALIRDGVVANVIVGSLEFAQSLGFDAAVETDSAGIGWAWDGETLSAPVVETAAPQTLAEYQAALKQQATELRWQHETGGITVGGTQIATGIEDQNRIASVLVASPAQVDFKSESGWVSLTLAELQAIAAAISAHVQACFTAERTHHTAIDALATVEDAQSYDVTGGWPDDATGA